MRRLPLLVALVVVVLLTVAGAAAEVVQVRGLRVAFHASFTPGALPRDREKPVSLHLSASITTASGARPPQLRRVVVAVNRQGRLFTRGLPVCSAPLLQSTTTRDALGHCRPALVGTGTFGAELAVTGSSPVPSRGRLLAFNGNSGGRPLFLLHFYASSPVQETLVIPFRVSKEEGGGELSTVLSGRIPQLAGGQAYVTDIRLRLGRRFAYRGHPESLLSASCAAPAGFRSAIFDLARGRFDFANGQRLTTTLTGRCRVL
jgi:hypothetical protein